MQALNKDDPYYAYSDAFVDSDRGGLGGYVHGEYWHYDLNKVDCSLMHIGAWEFVALGINIVIYAERLPGQKILFLADALAPIQIMQRGAAHSPVLQIIHDAIIHLPEFQAIGAHGLEEHVFGEVNGMADAASRENYDFILDVGLHLGFQPRLIDLPARALEFIEHIRGAIRAYERQIVPEVTPRRQSRAEVDRMHHLGSPFLGSEDTPLRFRGLDEGNTGSIFDIRCTMPGFGVVRRQSKYEVSSMHHLGIQFLGTSDSPLRFLAWAFGKRIEIDVPTTRLSPPTVLSWSSLSVGTAGILPTGHESTCRLSPPTILGWTSTSGLEQQALAMASSRPLEIFSVVGQGFVPAAQEIHGRISPPTILAWSCDIRLGKTQAKISHEPMTAPRLMQPKRAPLGVPLAESSTGLKHQAVLGNNFTGNLPKVPKTHQLLDDVFRGGLKEQTSSLLQTLEMDASEQRLIVDDARMLQAFVAVVEHATIHSIPKGTRGKNASCWKEWVQFVGLFNTSPLRDSGNGSRYQAREDFLKAAIAFYLYRKLKSSISGRQRVKPASVMAYLYAVARVHEMNGCSFLVRGRVKHLKQYISVEYALVHGPEALIPRRREGITRDMVRRMLEALPGLATSSRAYPSIFPGSWLERNVRAVLCVSASGGFRKAEVSLPEGDEFTAMHMSRASLFFIIDGAIERSPSVVQLASMRFGDQAGIIACPCKNDPLGIHFMPHPLLFNFDSRDFANTALVLRDLALHCPVAAEKLRSTPLFTYAENGSALRRGFLDTILLALLKCTMDLTLIGLYSWHSFRIGLASALKNARAPDWIILALLRWRSASSIPGYGRIDFATSSDWLDRACQQNVIARQVPNLPSLSNASRSKTATLPNVLPQVAYECLNRTEADSNGLDRRQCAVLTDQLIGLDDDAFVQEFMALGDEDPADGILEE